MISYCLKAVRGCNDRFAFVLLLLCLFFYSVFSFILSCFLVTLSFLLSCPVSMLLCLLFTLSILYLSTKHLVYLSTRSLVHSMFINVKY